MFCNHCGIKIDGEHLFCPNCGEKLPPRQAKSRYPRWLRWLFGICVIGVIVSFYFLLTETKPESTIAEQLNALKTHQYTEAYYGYTSSDFQEATSLEKFKEVIHTFPHLLNVKSISILHQDIQDSLATLKVSLDTEDNYNFVMEYQLIKDDEKWKILYFKLLNEPPKKD